MEVKYIFASLLILCANSAHSSDPARIKWKIQFAGSQAEGQSLSLGHCELLLQSQELEPMLVYSTISTTKVPGSRVSKIESDVRCNLPGCAAKWLEHFGDASIRGLLQVSGDQLLVLSEQIGSHYFISFLDLSTGSITRRIAVPGENLKPMCQLFTDEIGVAHLLVTPYGHESVVYTIDVLSGVLKDPIRLKIENDRYFLSQKPAMSKSKILFVVAGSKPDITGLKSNLLYAFDQNKKPIWHIGDRDELSTILSVFVKDEVFVNSLVESYPNGLRHEKVFIIDQNTGNIVYERDGRLLEIGDNLFYVFDVINNDFLAIDIHTKEIKWKKHLFPSKYQKKERFIYEMVAKEIHNALYLGAANFSKVGDYHPQTGIFALNIENGNELWFLNTATNPRPFRVQNILGLDENSIVVQVRGLGGTQSIYSIGP
ncbi:MAG: hypothetical protein HY072_03925 [Deltaproteobacteria bacterium]|nr:hypothetical protein [Deltaproteobacteria bacterium]